MIISIQLAQMCLFAAGNTTKLRSHLSCKHRETKDEMIGKELLNISVTSQNKYNFSKD